MSNFLRGAYSLTLDTGVHVNISGLESYVKSICGVCECNSDKNSILGFIDPKKGRIVRFCGIL